MQRIILPLLGMLIASPIARSSDTFSSIKDSLRQANCVELGFKSIIESSVFRTTDTIVGSATIATDGRYLVALGKDKYLFDGTDMYSYSFDNNQVVIERPKPGEELGTEVSFITRLDEIFKTTILYRDSVYRLVRATSTNSNVPDSLVLTIDKKAHRIKSIEYLDTNEEQNRVIFTRQSLHQQCDSAVFAPEFPDSADRVRIE